MVELIMELIVDDDGDDGDGDDGDDEVMMIEN